MAISLRNVTSLSQTLATTIVLNKPTGVVAGDVMYAAIFSSGDNVHQTSPGWTEVAFANDASDGMSILRLVAGASEPTSYTFTAPFADIANGAIFALIGVDNVTPEDATATVSAGTTNSATAPTITTVTPNAWWIGIFQTNNTGSGLGTPTNLPTNLVPNYGSAGTGLFQRSDAATIASPGATGTAVSTIGGGGTGWLTASLAIRPAASASAGVAATYQRMNPQWGPAYKGAINRFHRIQQQAGPKSTVQNLSQLLTATLSFTGPTNLTKTINKGVTGGLSFVGAIVKRTMTNSLTGATLTFAGAFVKSTNKNVTAVLSFTGVTNLPKAITKGMSGALSFTGPTHLLNATTKALAAATLSFSGVVTKLTIKTAFSATLSFAGAILTGKALHQAFTATLSFVGTQARLTNRGMAGGLSFTGPTNPLKAITKGITATLSFTGVGPVNAITKGVSAALSFSGATAITKILHQAFTGGLSFVGAPIVKQAGKALSGGLSFTGPVTLPHFISSLQSSILSFGTAIAESGGTVKTRLSQLGILDDITHRAATSSPLTAQRQSHDLPLSDNPRVSESAPLDDTIPTTTYSGPMET